MPAKAKNRHNKPWGMYKRFCKRCGRYYESEYRNGRICINCDKRKGVSSKNGAN